MNRKMTRLARGAKCGAERGADARPPQRRGVPSSAGEAEHAEAGAACGGASAAG